MLAALGSVFGLSVAAVVWHSAPGLLARYRRWPANVALEQTTPQTAGSRPGQSEDAGHRRSALQGGVRRFLLAGVMHAGLALFGAYLGGRSVSVGTLVLAVAVTGLLVLVGLVDLQTHRVPNVLCLALTVCALAQSLWRGQPALASAGLGTAVAGGLFLLLSLVQRGALGAGDVKLMAALGALLGYPTVVPGIAWGLVAGGAAALYLLATRRAGRRDAIAYAPYLALGAWIVWTRSLIAGP